MHGLLLVVALIGIGSASPAPPLTFLDGVLVGAVVAWLVDRYVYATLAHAWAFRRHRGR